MLDLEKIQKICFQIASENGKILIEKWSHVSISSIKESNEICTNLDLEIENNILDTLQKKFKKHNFNLEEKGIINKNSPYTWYIDPIDGTRNYFRHLPIFSISIALAYRNEVIFGLVYNPVTHELFYASKDKGAFLRFGNQEHFFQFEEIKKLHVSDSNKLKHSFLCIGMPKEKDLKTEKNLKILKNFLTASERIRAIGSIALSLCYIAAGTFDGYLNFTEV
ncbi:hypothetical protein A2483_03660, partial [Candidatus Peregrinibacteria bacterium RIFOXYC2_FULL_33_13]